ncbi:Homoserine/homoserine lactone efflux protein [Pseudoruegeria aquimaris]|uniref:Homoserine/homoserine lactone efflux protein n=1 Tax=Pseudoruegeria aquimaris TaxID=393663 RepID=A0A1Y5RJQ1_9RHOB|nr:LysE family translocator [Pseudoruegeria aquimaris]SLN18939.1 Homoserine/homoserine lactone efflux protein [Pseudoruegeria aquimaris]
MGVATGSFLLFAASQVATPGPANMALLTTGARYGLRAAMPFVLGVVAGKQLIIWPIGLGLMGLAETVPWVFEGLKWVSAAYICWLAWRVANLRLAPGEASGKAPGFWAGLLVHPLNPKAWAMITAGFTAFVSPGTPALQATATIAICLCICQLVFHPIWTWGGDRIAARVAGTPAERYLMGTLAALTVASVLFVLFGGGTA